MILAVLLTTAVIYAMEQRQQARDFVQESATLIVGIEESLGEPKDLDKLKKRLLEATAAAGYVCEPSPKGSWTCHR